MKTTNLGLVKPGHGVNVVEGQDPSGQSNEAENLDLIDAAIKALQDASGGPPPQVFVGALNSQTATITPDGPHVYRISGAFVVTNPADTSVTIGQAQIDFKSPNKAGTSTLYVLAAEWQKGSNINFAGIGASFSALIYADAGASIRITPTATIVDAGENFTCDVRFVVEQLG